MTLLFDQNISFRVVKLLKNQYPDCKHVSDCGLHNSDDKEIWDFARKNNLTIVTFDSDFYDISIIHGHPPKIIWLREGNLTTQKIADRLIQERHSIKQFLIGKELKNMSCLEII